MTEPLDQAALDTLVAMVGDDPDFVDELVDEYLADVPVQVAAMRSAADRGIAADLVRPAHTLKGTSASLGARNVEWLCRTIEEHGRAGSVDGIADLLRDLDLACDAAAAALTDARARHWARS